MKVFKLVSETAGKEQYASAQAVGEIIQVDPTGHAGLVMMNLETLHSNQGNFAVIPSRDGDSSEEAGAEGLPAATKTVTERQSTDSEYISFISTYRPAWFHGLDEKTNLKLDL